MKKILLFGLISLIIAVLGLAIFPKVISYFSIYYLRLDISIIIELIVCFLAVLLVTAFLFRDLSGISFGRAILSAIFTYLFFAIVILAISFLSGIFAEFIYNRYKEQKTLEEIKRIIDIGVRIFNILILPLLISAFWSTANSDKNPLKVFFKGLLPRPMVYLKLLGISVVLFGFGLIIGFLPLSSAGTIIKIVLLTIIGTFSLYITEKACEGKVA